LPYAYDGSLREIWSRVKFQEGAPVLAVVRPSAGGGLDLGDPVVVTSDQRDMDNINNLQGLTAAIDQANGGMQRAVDALLQNPNPAVAGLLLALNWYRYSTADPVRFTELIG